MANSINRRNAFKAATASLASIAIPTIALATSSPDTELEALADQLASISQQQADLWPVTVAKMREAESLYPPMPDATRATERDIEKLGLPIPTEGFHKPVSHYGRFLQNELFQIASRFPIHPVKSRRVKEITDAIEQWSIQCRAIDRQCGLTAIEQEGDRLNTLFSDTLDRIEAIEAKSLACLRAKAKAIALIHRDEPLIELGDCTDERLAAQIANALASIDSLAA